VIDLDHPKNYLAIFAVVVEFFCSSCNFLCHVVFFANWLFVTKIGHFSHKNDDQHFNELYEQMKWHGTQYIYIYIIFRESEGFFFPGGGSSQFFFFNISYHLIFQL